MKKLFNKILKKLGYVPTPKIPVFEYNVYKVYMDRIEQLKEKYHIFPNIN